MIDWAGLNQGCIDLEIHMAKKGTAGAAKPSPAPKTKGAPAATINQASIDEAKGAGTNEAKAAPAPAAAAKPDTSAGQNSSTKSIPGLEVTSTRDGFRRAGRPWFKQPTVVRLDELTKEQVAMLRNDPDLTVREVEVPAGEEEA